MAEQRIQYTEEMVGAGHPTKADTLNRLMLVEHGTDGAHKSTNVYTDLITKGPWRDVRAYGAVGDGVTDDTAAIQAALDDIPYTGGKVFIPFGTYKVSSTLTASNTTELFGVGANGSIISTASPTAHVIAVYGGGCYIHDIQISSSVTKTAGAHIFIATSGSSSTIERFMLYNYFVGIDIYADCCVRVFNGQCRFGVSGTWTAGIAISAGTDHKIDQITMDNVVGTQCESGIRVTSADAPLITNCDIIHHGTGLNIWPGAGQIVSSLWAANSFFDNNNMRGATLGGAGTISRCRFADCWFSSNTWEGIHIFNTCTIAGVDISNPHVFLNGAHGVQVDKSCDDLKISGGFIGGNGQDGIAIASNVSNFSIIGVRSGNGGGAGNNGLAGIRVNAGTSNQYIISLCNVLGNTGGGIIDNGTGMDKIVNFNMG
ncbi:MAG: right-handed parallel beta-helix repeat-containing protein [Deltaproteobacteria bacterium]|nr:right-handed parallel beta-helix repeat-containing protein [Deltaproteobacteria bacterium]